ncbi:MAG: MlaA family lipoprotein [Rhodospirillales bacterium]
MAALAAVFLFAVTVASPQGAAFAEPADPPKADEAAAAEDASDGDANDGDASDGNGGDSDPFEGINRVTSTFNRALRTMLLVPLAEIWTKLTPPPLQEVTRNAAANLTEPMTALSSLLQGDTENAGLATKRFLINSTFGVAGLNDKATEEGFVSRKEDLGQAAAVNGVAAGPHLVLPVLGPSNTRDAFVDVVNALVNPLSIAEGVDKAIGYADNKDAIEAISANSVDPYTAEKTAFEQHREFQILNGEVGVSDGPAF